MKPNSYSCTAFQGSRKVGFMKYVNRPEDYAKWLDRKGISWSLINVYDRKTSAFIRRLYNK